MDMNNSERDDGDDRTFDANFTDDGAARLRERLRERLKEFMGDYTDDTLVEYVIVLLRNGRQKDEARRELNVFLGNDSFSFVTWLWDHLSSNMHLYMDSKHSLYSEADKLKSMSNDMSGGQNSHGIYASGFIEADSDHRRERSEKIPRIHRNREWKGFVHDMEPFPNQSTMTKNVYLKEKIHHRLSIVRRSPSPKHQVDRKRARQDEQSPKKRETAVPSVGAPRRLLQFAVRDAVKTVKQSNLRAEPASKRLRSVVSASIADVALEEKTQRSRSAARAPPAVSTVVKAAVEAAENVSKKRNYASVFDRLGCNRVGKRRKLSDYGEAAMKEVEEDGELDKLQKSDQVTYCQRKEYQEGLAGNVTISNRDTGISVDSASDNDGYDEDADSVSHNYLKSRQTLTSAKKEKDSLPSQYSVAQNVDNTARRIRPVDQDGPANGTTKSPSKIVNISVNVNTWENQNDIEMIEGSAVKSNVALEEKSNPIHEKEKEESRANVQKELQKAVKSISGSYMTARPLEDLNSRTVYVSNVHFATTKDILSRHFNKFGEVRKVVIVTDATTGQPTGSAYVEFLRKESAELALSLNGTSFMSRILKVVLKNSGHPEAAAMIGWPRGLRGSRFPSRFCGVPYGRALFPRAFRGRLQVKSGARSLQWKRDASTVKTDGVKAPQGASVSFPSGVHGSRRRNLTYVRAESTAGGGAARV